MHVESCLVELALNKYKLVSLLRRQEEYPFGRWGESSEVKAHVLLQTICLYLSSSQSHFPSFLSIFINPAGSALTSPLRGVQSPELMADDSTGDIQLRTSTWDSVSFFCVQPGCRRDPSPSPLRSRNPGHRRECPAPLCPKTTCLGIRRPEFKSQLCLIPAVWLWAHFLTS